MHPRSQYPEPRNHARSGFLSVPPAPWCYPSDPPKTEARRRRGLNHRPNGATVEDSGVDAVAGMRRDKDHGATTFEEGRSSVAHLVSALVHTTLKTTTGRPCCKQQSSETRAWATVD